MPELLRTVLRRILLLGKAFWKAIGTWSDHRAASKGAALAFYVLFSLAPLLVMVLWVTGLFIDPALVRGEILSQLRGLVGPQGEQAIETLLTAAVRPEGRGLTTLIAFATLLVGATTAFAELKGSLDEIWEVPPVARSGWWQALRTRLLSVGLVFALAFLALVTLVVDAGLAVVEKFWTTYLPFAEVLGPISSGLSLVIIAGLFAVLYKFLPDARPAWGDVWVGAVSTTLLFALGKHLIGLYLGNTSSLSAYGAASALAALLLWLYYSAQIFFFGAEFTRQYIRLTEPQRELLRPRVLTPDEARRARRGEVPKAH